jgi:hypothetical protein
MFGADRDGTNNSAGICMDFALSRDSLADVRSLPYRNARAE